MSFANEYRSYHDLRRLLGARDRINPFTGKKEDPKRGCEDVLFTFDFESVKVNQVESCALPQKIQEPKPSKNQALFKNLRKNCFSCATRFLSSLSVFFFQNQSLKASHTGVEQNKLIQKSKPF